MLEKLAIPFEVKELSDSGEFIGIASVYGNVDMGGDVVDPGAFTKTIKERGNKVRLLDNHKTRIGLAQLSDIGTGLQAVGKINLDKPDGKNAYSDLKFYRDNGMPMGMSIGYQTVKADAEGNVRHLKELKLFEVTLTEFPMNEQARVVSVKSFRRVLDVIEEHIAEMKSFGPLSEEDRPKALEICSALMSLARNPNVPDDLDFKAGRMISAANQMNLKAAHAHMMSAADILSPLLNCDAEPDGMDAEPTSKSAAGTPETKPAPVPDHSAIEGLLDRLKSAVLQ